MVVEKSANNRRIAKNTLFLYLRLIVTLLVNLYTSRIVLDALGIENYGIYNVVGGFVIMFSMITGTLSAAITRFLTFELGKRDLAKLKKVFSTSVLIQFFLAIIVFIIAECIGLWYLHYKMVMPTERVPAAIWCFHFSLITFCVGLISVPYNAAIIAHEKMSAFAYISIVDACGKLFIAYIILISSFDKLIFYGLFIALLSIVIRLIYGLYCRRNFAECSIKLVFDKNLLKQMFGFAGWNLIGSAAGVLRDQGGIVLVNAFFGPTMNAAQALAIKVSNVVTGFSSNFLAAVNPQITKSYAGGDQEYTFELVFQSARLAFYMVLFLSLPLIFNADFLLSIWLKQVPEGTILFVRLVLVMAMVEVLSYPLVTLMLATGNIRNYQIVVGGLQLLNIPISYLLFTQGCIPQTVLIVAIVVGQLCLFARLIMLKKCVGLNVAKYLKNVYLNILAVSVISVILPFFALKLCAEIDDLVRFLVVSFVSILSVCISCLFVGCSEKERKMFFSKIKKKIYCHD